MHVKKTRGNLKFSDFSYSHVDVQPCAPQLLVDVLYQLKMWMKCEKFDGVTVHANFV